jgi:hypothetical protein
LQRIGQGEKIQVIEGRRKLAKAARKRSGKYSEKKRDTVKAA